ncbi:MAG: 2,3-bisphosphoglycerate-independent phosphoglycerate mutase [Desulfovibrionaceae bacterium]|nr:2,3-bisphosphoglycerate-independent phosphoglycerate mutase [Desulfovibrionaceae bacterium]
MNKVTPTLLLILDGWGIAPHGPGNAPYVAKTPVLDELFASCPNTHLTAHGLDVGLPQGYMGNSEVGHLNIGAGRIVYQDMTRIDMALADGSFAKNTAINDLIFAVKASGGALHFAGLISDGGVHSHIEHLIALCRLAAGRVPVRIHCIMDGRDTDPQSGAGYLTRLQEGIAALPDCHIVDLVGRFYAMDRDKRWERVERGWKLFVHGEAEAQAESSAHAIEASYAAGFTDEFVKPVIIKGFDGMHDGDGLFLFNFRADRMRELTRAFIDPNFTEFQRICPNLAGIASMTPYEASFGIPVAFPKESVTNGLAEVVSKAGMRQLHLAETEKYAHVTYFFNGGLETPFPGEDRIMVDSPREVPTYDLKPSMSAREVTDNFVEKWQSGIYDLVVCNLANGDMVGHTGVLPAAIEACEVVDECVGRMVMAVRKRGGRMLLIADHGNCEVMLTADGRPHTAHTTNLVPCLLVETGEEHTLRPGRLADVAPTILSLWGMPQSSTMTGTSLVG